VTAVRKLTLQIQVKAGVSDEEIAGYQHYVQPTMPEMRRAFFQAMDVVYMVVENADGKPAAGLIAGDAGAEAAICKCAFVIESCPQLCGQPHS
jgi:hypothetical protein